MALRGPDAPHTPPAAAQEADQRLHQRRRAALEAPRRADARQVPHEQPEIDAADLDEQPFQDVGMPAQMDADGCAEFRQGVDNIWWVLERKYPERVRASEQIAFGG